MANSADPDQLASSEATDLDLHCLQNRVYPGSTGQELRGMSTLQGKGVVGTLLKLFLPPF